MAFTFIFAFYCGKIMLKYDSYYCAAMLHIYCNTMGFPPVEQLFPLDFKNHQKNGNNLFVKSITHIYSGSWRICYWYCCLLLFYINMF